MGVLMVAIWSTETGVRMSEFKSCFVTRLLKSSEAELAHTQNGLHHPLHWAFENTAFYNVYDAPSSRLATCQALRKY